MAFISRKQISVEYEILEKMFQGEKPKSIFEVGCANGGLLKDLNDYYGGIKVGGLDIHDGDLQKIRDTFPNGTFYKHDLSLPFYPKEKFDIVFSVGVLCYIPNPFPVLENMLRIGETILLAEFHDGRADEYGKWGNVPQSPYNRDDHTDRDYRKVFQTLGLSYEIIGYLQGKTIFKCRR
jgi:SAM-dependent methyltransferase